MVPSKTVNPPAMGRGRKKIGAPGGGVMQKLARVAFGPASGFLKKASLGLGVADSTAEDERFDPPRRLPSQRQAPSLLPRKELVLEEPELPQEPQRTHLRRGPAALEPLQLGDQLRVGLEPRGEVGRKKAPRRIRTRHARPRKILGLDLAHDAAAGVAAGVVSAVNARPRAVPKALRWRHLAQVLGGDAPVPHAGRELAQITHRNKRNRRL
mmetsp:Transcript_40902/g.92043  ORF Transcript_40902/g.92043 Transcript_40902/m.92043 type:complete len:211 (+) Transcript_40902:182-814(+)